MGLSDGYNLVYEDANARVVIDWHAVALGAAVQAHAQKASLEAAEAILEYANTIVPYDKGLLESTGRATPISGQGSGSAIVSYGTVYAVHLHEHPEFHFQNGREGKWLEKALSRAQGRAVAAMVAEISKSFVGPGLRGMP